MYEIHGREIFISLITALTLAFLLKFLQTVYQADMKTSTPSNIQFVYKIYIEQAETNEYQYTNEHTNETTITKKKIEFHERKRKSSSARSQFQAIYIISANERKHFNKEIQTFQYIGL